ncbi:hypothetical protein F5X99DRAFT_413164 [Biscogniauxia marginata]|nr:hypothetical protein F5X99DRAFT_413164 [Biscogniauxia marginata]
MANVTILWNLAQKGFNSEHYELEKVIAAGMGGDMQWSEHVVNLTTIPNNPFTDNRFVVMEFIPGGTLSDFKKECKEDIPVRVLWHIFLCLVRACTAMAYPPTGETDAAGVAIPVIEDVHISWEPDHFAHRDLHPGNILLGDFDTTNKEHKLVPILRLVDFERGQHLTALEDYDSEDVEDWDEELELNTKRDAGKRNPGIDHNILSIGRVMANLIGPLPPRFLSAEDCRERFEDDNIHSCADLRDLVKRCLAVDPMNRPRLEALLPLLRSYVLDIKTEQYYQGLPNGDRESDANVKEFMENYLAGSRQKQGV